MITEDYVSIEVAKLLKEKGFDEDIDLWYDENGEMFSCNKYCISGDWRVKAQQEVYLCPTLQMTMKWLREVHNIFFNVNYFHIDVGNKWSCLTIRLPYKNGCELSIEGFDIETIYESAIKYCLENLI